MSRLGTWSAAASFPLKPGNYASRGSNCLSMSFLLGRVPRSPVMLQNSGIKLLKVLSASKQVVAGTLLKLRLLIADGENAVEYEAKVWEKPWENFRQVTEFKAVPDSSRALSAVELEAANDGKMLPTMADDDAAAASSGASALTHPEPGQRCSTLFGMRRAVGNPQLC